MLVMLITTLPMQEKLSASYIVNSIWQLKIQKLKGGKSHGTVRST